VSYLNALDHWSLEADNNSVIDETLPLSADTIIDIANETGTVDSIPKAYPALGFLPLRCVFNRAEGIRLNKPSNESGLANAAQSAIPVRDVICFSGHAGSGVLTLASQCADRLKQVLPFGTIVAQAIIQTETGDSADLKAHNGAINDAIAGISSSAKVVVVVLINNPKHHVAYSDSLSLVASKLQASIAFLVTVLSSTSLRFSPARTSNRYN